MPSKKAKTPVLAKRRGRRPRSAQSHMTQLPGLTQAQPVTLPGRSAPAAPAAEAMPDPVATHAATSVKKKKAASARTNRARAGSPVAHTASAAPTHADAAPVRGVVFEGAIQELLKSKRNKLTPAVAEQILKLLIDL